MKNSLRSVCSLHCWQYCILHLKICWKSRSHVIFSPQFLKKSYIQSDINKCLTKGKCCYDFWWACILTTNVEFKMWKIFLEGKIIQSWVHSKIQWNSVTSWSIGYSLRPDLGKVHTDFLRVSCSFCAVSQEIVWVTKSFIKAASEEFSSDYLGPPRKARSYCSLVLSYKSVIII